MAKTKVSLLVDDDSLARLSDLVKQIKGAGVDVEQVLESSGVVTGSVDPERVSALKKIKGISSVEEDRQFNIPPPESELQ